MFEKILIANRGEIACRILDACEKLGIRAVTVHSEADAGAPHVTRAHASVCVGPAPVAQSYLNQQAILEAAKAHGCQAVHPGYGLLSENAGFARAVDEAGMVFIGPRPEVIQAMGSKTDARDTMGEAGVPLVPGTPGGVPDLEAALAAAQAIGYPVMLKASAGGGGIGMQAVNDPSELEKAWKMSTTRAKAYFGSDAMYLEKLIRNPRHVEVQVLADGHGNVSALFERDCSVQRRHQKVVEEAPAPNLSEKTRAAMREVAVRAATAIGYESAGTLEFLVDAEESFYFLEMNTRIQVEHPVTEAITGVDLVAEQIRIAAGEPISAAAAEPAMSGHAVEARVYAEDPVTFFPSPGTLAEWRVPEGVRVDTWVASGTVVTPHYDPLLAKIVAHGADRAEAIAKLEAALGGLVATGLKTNVPALLAILRDEQFRAGRYGTDFIATRLASASKT